MEVKEGLAEMVRGRRLGCVLLMCSVALVLSGCPVWPQRSAAPPGVAGVDVRPVPSERLRLPPGEYLNVAWLPDGTIAVNYIADPEDVQSQRRPLKIYRLERDGTQMRELRLPQQPGCVRTDYIVNGVMADGRLLAGRNCVTGEPGDAGRSEAIAVDMATAQMTTMAPLRSYSAAVAWRPGASEGVASYAGGRCASLTAIDSSGFLPAPQPVMIDGRSWHLDTVFRPGFEFSNSPKLCQPYGRARDAQYTNDGNTIVFFASPQTIGVSGKRREDIPWNMYRASPVAGGQLLDATSIRKVLTGIGDPHGLALSQDGRWASVAGDFGRHWVGAWLTDTTTGRARLLGKGSVNTTAFSPDRRQVIATVTDRLGRLESHLEIYTLPASL